MKKKSNLKIEQEKTDLSKPISVVGATPWDETNYIYIYKQPQLKNMKIQASPNESSKLGLIF